MDRKPTRLKPTGPEDIQLQLDTIPLKIYYILYIYLKRLIGYNKYCTNMFIVEWAPHRTCITTVKALELMDDNETSVWVSLPTLTLWNTDNVRN